MFVLLTIFSVFKLPLVNYLNFLNFVNGRYSAVNGFFAINGIRQKKNWEVIKCKVIYCLRTDDKENFYSQTL